jgi:hypothetical protein
VDVDLHHATLSMGAVERIPGVGYVHTKFLLLMYFPVLPELSELVLDDPAIGGGREVAPVPLNWRSIVVVYARWVIAAPIPFAVYWATEDPLRGGLATAACLLAMAMTFGLGT